MYAKLKSKFKTGIPKYLMRMRKFREPKPEYALLVGVN